MRQLIQWQSWAKQVPHVLELELIIHYGENPYWHQEWDDQQQEARSTSWWWHVLRSLFVFGFFLNRMVNVGYISMSNVQGKTKLSVLIHTLFELWILKVFNVHFTSWCIIGLFNALIPETCWLSSKFGQTFYMSNLINAWSNNRRLECIVSRWFLRVLAKWISWSIHWISIKISQIDTKIKE